MPQSIRSILGKSGGRVKKPSRPAPPKQGTSSPSPRKAKRDKDKEEEKDAFLDKLEDLGVARLLAEEQTLRDVIQAMRFVRSRMFSPVPATGFNSTRTAELLNYRLSIPPIVTTGHLNAILHSPSQVERETVELLGKGFLRRVRIQRRSVIGEALIESSSLEDIITRAQLSGNTTETFIRFLKQNPIAQTMPQETVSDAQADELIRAGLLTSSTQATPGTTLHMRPEDRTTLTSIQHVSRFASGSVSAVGGRNAIHLAGGGGGAPTLTRSSSSSSDLWDFRLAVPGHGRYLKLAEGAVEWVREALGRTRWGEAPESWLRERFEGGGLYGARWREFWGVEWEWVVGEAVGVGAVEVFETGSVGRGVRAMAG